MATVYEVGGDDDSAEADQVRSSRIRVPWPDENGADQTYVFKDVRTSYELMPHAVRSRLLPSAVTGLDSAAEVAAASLRAGT